MWSPLPLLLSVALGVSPVSVKDTAVQLTLDDDQRSIAVVVDQQIHITLQRPADDLQQSWTLLEPPIQHIVRMQRSAEGPDRMTEQPQRWAFVASGPGAQRLRFELRRRGEVKFEAERSYSVLLEVGH